MFDILVVGAGISGATIAERYASQMNKKVLVIEKRDHIGGNCYDYMHNDSGILVSKYGAHLFHTNSEKVWEYIQKFSNWYPYEHRVKSYVDGILVPVPVNISTINLLFNTYFTSPGQMQNWLEKRIVKNVKAKNSEESALSRVGTELYEKMFKFYTKKQWDMWPNELEASVMERIPVHFGYDDRYFLDKYQALPLNGYTKLFENMLDHKNIRVDLNVDFFNSKPTIDVRKFEKVYFTGRIDQFFEAQFDRLQYRSLDFVFEHCRQPYFQSNSVINYPQTEKFTRIVEYKYFTRTESKSTVISKEYGRWEGEPYYPVPSPKNRERYAQYQALATSQEEKGIFFVGRLANYKYFNMDQAFENALEAYEKTKS